MIDALLQAVRRRRERHGNIVVTLDMLESIFEEAASPGDYSHQAPAAPIPQLQVPAEWPKRMVRCGQDHEVLETRVVHTFSELQALQKTGAWYRWEGG